MMKPVYKRMLNKLAEQVADTPAGETPWWVYIIECADGTFYTGITNDLDRRVAQHQEGKAARYTRSRRPVHLRYSERVAGRSQALVREAKIKAMSRSSKKKLIESGG